MSPHGVIGAVALLLSGCSTGPEPSASPARIDETGAETSTAQDLTGPDHGGDDTNVIVGDDECDVDADCVAAECCHAAACVAVVNAPDCDDAICTTDCQFGTLDCGGGCLCVDGRCSARLSQPPHLGVDP